MTYIGFTTSRESVRIQNISVTNCGATFGQHPCPVTVSLFLGDLSFVQPAGYTVVSVLGDVFIAIGQAGDPLGIAGEFRITRCAGCKRCNPQIHLVHNGGSDLHGCRVQHLLFCFFFLGQGNALLFQQPRAEFLVFVIQNRDHAPVAGVVIFFGNGQIIGRGGRSINILPCGRFRLRGLYRIAKCPLAVLECADVTLFVLVSIQDDSIFTRIGSNDIAVQSVVGGLPGDAHIAAVRLALVQCGDDGEIQLHALPGGIRVFSQGFRLALVLQRPGVPGGFVFSVIGQSSVKRFRLAGVHLLPLICDFHILPVQFHGQGKFVPHAGFQQIALRSNEFQRCGSCRRLRGSGRFRSCRNFRRCCRCRRRFRGCGRLRGGRPFRHCGFLRSGRDFRFLGFFWRCGWSRSIFRCCRSFRRCRGSGRRFWYCRRFRRGCGFEGSSGNASAVCYNAAYIIRIDHRPKRGGQCTEQHCNSQNTRCNPLGDCSFVLHIFLHSVCLLRKCVLKSMAAPPFKQSVYIKKRLMRNTWFASAPLGLHCFFRE